MSDLSTPQRVLHVCAVEYSARTLLLPQLRFLRGVGFDVRVACAPDGDHFCSDLDPFQPRQVRFSRQKKPAAMLAAAKELGALIAELKPDLVHLHSPAAAFSARLLPASVLRTQPVVYTVHGFPFQWNRRLFGPDGAVLVAEYALARRTRMLLFQSQEDLARARRLRFGAELRYLGNGVQDHWFSVPPRQRRGQLTLLFVGRLVREKGILELLEALEATDDVVLQVAGTRIASERDDIRSDIDALLAHPKLDGRVEMLGHVDPADLVNVMAGVDALVLPSYREGVPRSVIEAMASGRPVIATNVRGCRELVRTGVNGWLVPARDPDALAEAIRSAQKATGDELASLGSTGREIAWDRYREAVVFERLTAAYADLGVTTVT